MSPATPDGEIAPADGSLPSGVAHGAMDRTFGVYVHVPFCAVRCGYCDFNTYTATELGGGASQSHFANTARLEIDLAAHVMSAAAMAQRAVSTVFFGGGTPTILPASDLVGVLNAIKNAWGLAEGAEVTTEANPDSIDADYLKELAGGGFTRISLGVQSAVPHVLATLERTHNPQRLPAIVRSARDAGLAVSLDLIYGTPGESIADWERSLDFAISLEPDHLSAYALVLEEGTRMARQVRLGELPSPDDDDAAAKYEIADTMLATAGFRWYEVSNWAKPVGKEGEIAACRHNLAYWNSDDWWGIGPGAHSHMGGSTAVRWWNVKHPRAYASRLEAGNSPALARELIDSKTAYIEDILLQSRLAQGLEIARIAQCGQEAIPSLIAEGLIDGKVALTDRRIVLTRQGRLLADLVVRKLLP